MIYERKRRYVTFGLIGAILLLIGIGLLSYRTIYKGRQQANSIARAHQIIELTEIFVANIHAAETGNRGFIITNDSAYLNTFIGAAAKNDSILHSLFLLTDGSAAQQERVKQLSAINYTRFQRMNLVQKTAESKGFEAAKELINEGKGKKLMESIRQLSDELINEEYTQLHEREAAAGRIATSTYFTIISGTLLSILLILGVFFLLLQQINRTRRSEHKMRELKEAEEVLSEHLVQQNTQLQEFAYIISHNLRGPVNNLKALIEMYNDGSGSFKKEEIFSKINQETHYMGDTLNRMLEVLRIKQNANKKRENLSFEEVLKKVKDILNLQIVETNADIQADFSEAPAVTYPRTYLENILLHLLSNAIKFSHVNKPPKIYINSGHKNGETLLRVTDNGIGIDLEKYGHNIFSLNRAMNRNQQDKGISLFIIKNQVEALGGSIKVASEPGKGTTFTVFFGKAKPV